MDFSSYWHVVEPIKKWISPGIDGFLCNVKALVSNVIISERRTVRILESSMDILKLDSTD